MDDAKTLGTQVVFNPTGNEKKPYRISATASAVARLVSSLKDEGEAKDARSMLQAIEREYPGAVPAADSTTLVSFTISMETYTKLIPTIDAVGFARVNSETVMAEAPSLADVKKATKVKAVREAKPRTTASREGFEVGEVAEDGTITPLATWKPGHDARYKGILIKRVATVGEDPATAQAAAQEMVARGWWTNAKAEERLQMAQIEFDTRDQRAKDKAAAAEKREADKAAKAAKREQEQNDRLAARAAAEEKKALKAEAAGPEGLQEVLTLSH